MKKETYEIKMHAHMEEREKECKFNTKETLMNIKNLHYLAISKSTDGRTLFFILWDA